jgi:hypothetical protein
MSAPLTEKYNDIEAVKSKFLKKVEGLTHEQLNKIPARWWLERRTNFVPLCVCGKWYYFGNQ